MSKHILSASQLTKGIWMLGRVMTRLLPGIHINITDRCNSRCEICKVWQRSPKVDFPLKVIEEILSDGIVGQLTQFTIQGGEPLCHPQFEEICSLFSGRRWQLNSNALLGDKLVECVQRYKPSQVAISIDGARETYRRVRGVDAYEQVTETAIRLKESGADLHVGYVVSPWNSREDLINVKDFCQQNGISFLVSAYNDVEWFNATSVAGEPYPFRDLIEDNEDMSEAYKLYLGLYSGWLDGTVRLPCYSPRSGVIIMPDGDVHLCQGKEVVLGNLYQQSLSEIWHSKRTRGIQEQYRWCNGCWMNCHRSFDVALIHMLKRVFPQRIVDRITGGRCQP